MEEPESFAPRMTPGELVFFKKCIQSKKKYLEFGCGGSTVVAATSDLERIYSIDTDAEWIIKCQTHPAIAGRIAKKEARLFYLDVGKLKKWGTPATQEKRISWVAYSAGIWEELAELPDLILVDGRWRVACALQALWRCGDDARILVHDWNSRERYHEVLEFADIEGQVEQLVCLAPKPTRDRGLIAMRALARISDVS